MTMTQLRHLERKLHDQLERDRKRRSRRRVDDDGTIIVTPSGTACGLAWTIGLTTGEDPETIMNRVTR